MVDSPGKPIPYAAPPEPKGIAEKFVAYSKRLQCNYNMATSLYMMEPVERAIISESSFHFLAPLIFMHKRGHQGIKKPIINSRRLKGIRFVIYRLYTYLIRNTYALLVLGIPSTLHLETSCLHGSSYSSGRVQHFGCRRNLYWKVGALKRLRNL